MVFVNKSYDPVEIEKVGLVLEDGVVKKGTGGAIVPDTDERVVKATKTKLNWSLVGPAVAVMIFIFSWGGVISERAYTATINTDNIAKQEVKIGKQNVQIEELKKANERQEIMINKQMQVLKRQDQIIDMVIKIAADEMRMVRMEIKVLQIQVKQIDDKL